MVRFDQNLFFLNVINFFLAAIRITVDGGTNRWLNWLRKHNLEDKLKQPNLITGDLDSCFKESIAFFSKSRVIKTVDQDETDFTKSLRVLEPFIQELNLESVIALCETSGRMDQILANINSE
jgi:thiamine pyrophosphokinase